MVFQNADSIDIFLSLLRSGMYGRPLDEYELPETIDWERVVTLARKHAVYGIIIDSVQFLPERLRPSESLSDKMNKFALGLIQTNILLDRTAARLVAFFKQYGLEGVLLKGQGVARYYREPQMRHSGDIDFYVGRKNYKKAVALCKEKLIGDKGKWEKIGIHFTFKMRGVQIEIHRLASRMSSPFRNRRFQNWIVEQLEYSPDRRILTLDNTDITLPSYDFDAIFIFYHAWRHYIMGGIGMRQLCDWAMIFHTHAEDIDIPKLKHHIQRFGIIKEWQLFACIAVNHLGVPKDKIPLYDPSYSEKSEKIFQEIMDGGNFGFYTVANTRTPMLGYGLRHGLGKVRNITGYFISLFPLIPVEATFLYFHRLFHGTIDLIKRSRHKSDN